MARHHSTLHREAAERQVLEMIIESYKAISSPFPAPLHG